MSNSLRPHGLYSSLLYVIFPTQGSNPGLLHCRRILYQLVHKGSPKILEWVAYPFSSGSSYPRNRTGVSCIADKYLHLRVLNIFSLNELIQVLIQVWKSIAGSNPQIPILTRLTSSRHNVLLLIKLCCLLKLKLAHVFSQVDISDLLYLSELIF